MPSTFWCVEPARAGDRGRSDLGRIDRGGGTALVDPNGGTSLRIAVRISGLGARPPPAQEVVMAAEQPHGEVARKVPPRTPGAQPVQDGVEVFAPPFGRARPISKSDDLAQ